MSELAEQLQHDDELIGRLAMGYGLGVIATEEPATVDEPGIDDSDGEDYAIDNTRVGSDAEAPNQKVVVDPITLADFDGDDGIFARYHMKLTNYLFNMVGDYEQARDLAQDVMLKACRSIASGSQIASVVTQAWLYRIATNTGTDALRHRKLIGMVPLSHFSEDRGIGAGMPPEGSEPLDLHNDPLPETGAQLFASSVYGGGRFEDRVASREIIDHVLANLPSRMAQAVILRDHMGLPMEEVARTMDVTYGYAKNITTQARAMFRRFYLEETRDKQPNAR